MLDNGTSGWEFEIVTLEILLFASISVQMWRISTTSNLLCSFCFSVVEQFYQTRVIDEFVLRGNTGILKCMVPSFVSDFVTIVEWRSDENETYSSNEKNLGTHLPFYIQKTAVCFLSFLNFTFYCQF